MSWTANYFPDHIEVERENRPYASYSLLPPKTCVKCSHPLDSGVCTYCGDLDNFDRLYALGIYHSAHRDGDLSRHILSLKNDSSYAVPLGLALSLVVRNRYPELMGADTLVPVPIHDDKLDGKGFNQAYQIARQLSIRLGTPVCDCLIQIKNYSQHDSNRSTRFQNVENAFQLDPRASSLVNDRYLLVIDDIMTSGATINECARVLKKNGARKIDGLVLGRTG